VIYKCIGISLIFVFVVFLIKRNYKFFLKPLKKEEIVQRRLYPNGNKEKFMSD